MKGDDIDFGSDLETQIEGINMMQLFSLAKKNPVNRQKPCDDKALGLEGEGQSEISRESGTFLKKRLFKDLSEKNLEQTVTEQIGAKSIANHNFAEVQQAQVANSFEQCQKAHDSMVNLQNQAHKSLGFEEVSGNKVQNIQVLT